MLIQFHKQETNVGAALLAEADEYEDNTDYPEVLILGRQENEKDTTIGEHLREHQKDEPKALCDYSNVFSDYPEKTDLIKIKLTVKNNSPCRHSSDALKPTVDTEISKLRQNG